MILFIKEHYIYIAAILLLFAISGVIWIRAWLRSPARRGRIAEKRVRKTLSSLKAPDYRLLNDIIIATPAFAGTPPRQTQVDHILVSTRGVFVIETKGLTGHITGAEHAQFWNQKFFRSAHSFYNPILQNRTHIRALRRAVPSIPEEAIVSVVLFTDSWRIDILTEEKIIQRQLLPDLHIRRTLDPEQEVPPRWWRPKRKQVILDTYSLVTRLQPLIREIKRRKPILSTEMVELLAKRIQQVGERNESLKGRQAAAATNAAKASDAKIRAGICPRCGGSLLTRHGEYGPFLACSRYPQCRFVCSAAPRQ